MPCRYRLLVVTNGYSFFNMIDPRVSLGAIALFAALAAVLFRPRKGLFRRWRQQSKMTLRVRIEDALKHFHEAEYQGRPPTVQSLAGTLGMNDGEAAALIARVEALGLVERKGGELSLTSAGRADALRVIRLHRLYERYLAEETGVGELEWHDLAEEREHHLTAEQEALLTARLGNPLYDPHGDPIPTSEGDLPSQEGTPLSDLPAGKPGRIIHLEDEPAEVYAQLVAEGLYLGMGIRILETSPERILFLADGEEHRLAPVVAANISVVTLPEEEIEPGPVETLASLRPGEKGEVIRIVRACRGRQRRRLMDLGILPGTVIEARMRSASGDPTAYGVRGTLVALRKEQAEMIHISRPGEAA